MKRIILIIILYAAMVGVAQASQRGDVQVTFGFFYSSLAPHGEWIETDPGFYVWRPLHLPAGWRPYFHGRWVWSSYGWYWVSYEPLGWIVFHYGRWYYDDFYGWVWVPDYVWGPAWVEWRYNDDYIGWAPLPPYAIFSITIGIRFTRVWAAPVHYWTFIPCRYIVHHRIVDYVVPVERTRRFFGSTRSSTRYVVDNGRVVNRGIDVGFVERRAKTRIESVDIIETRERGIERMVRHDGRERIEVYRPNRDEIERATPPRIDVRRSERKLFLDRESLEKGKDRRTGQRENVDAREPQTRKEREVHRTPEQDRKREPSIEPKQPDTRTRPESPTREKERSSKTPRSERKR